MKKTGIFIFFFLILSISAQNNSYVNQLENGLKYYIHNEENADTNYLLLVVKVGSINETNAQKGYAHFLEHMAFKGGKRFKEETYVEFLNRNGFELGKHYNAQTNYEYTVYKITLPKNNNTEFTEKTLSFFADITDKLNFNSNDIKTEKRIVLQEMKTLSKDDPLFNFKLGNSLYKRRNPIGNEQSILNITAKKIRSFHEQWYAPNNSAIILVGNFPYERTKNLIEKYFSPIKKQGRLRNKKSLYNSLEDIVTVSHSQTEEVHITIAQQIQILSEKEKKTYQIFRKILESRLRERLPTQISSLWISGDKFLSDVYYTTISFKKDTNVYQNIREILLEIYKLSQKNISQKELDYHQTFNEKPQHKNAQILTEMYIDLFLNKNFYDNNTLVSLEDITKYAQSVLKNSKKRIFIESETNTLLPKSQIFTTNFPEPIADFDYTYFNKKNTEKEITIGIPNPIIESQKKYTKRHLFPSLNITELVYANGMKVYLKPLENNEKEIKIWGVAEGGTSHLPDSLYYHYESTIPYVELGGVGMLSSEEFPELLYQKKIGVTFGISEFYRNIYTSAKVENIEDLMKILRLKMTQQRGNTKDFHEIIQEEIDNIPNQKNESLSTAEIIATAKKKYFPRRAPAKTIQQFQNLNLDKMLQFYHKSFAYADGWRFLIIGNFEVAKVIPLVNHYFGSLKKGVSFPENRNLSLEREFKAEHLSLKETASLHQIYEKKYTTSLKNHLTIDILEKVLREHITKRLREKKGWVYSPIITIEKNILPNSYFIIEIITDTETAYIEKIENETKKIISELQTDTISNEQLSIHKKSLQTELKNVLEQNNLNHLTSFLIEKIKNKESLYDWEMYEKILNEITPEDLIKMIKDVELKAIISE